jgi:hypothetical protein
MFEAGYGAVETALVQGYRVPDDAVGAFRGRLAALQKQGFLGTTPGKGIALTYTPDLLHRLVFACEMFQFGISPAVVLGIVEAQWERRLRKIFRDAEDAAERDPGPNDVILHLAARVMTDTWSDVVPAVNACPLRKLPSNIAMWMKMTPDDPMGLPPRVLVTNLSAALRTFHANFARSFTDEQRAERTGKVEAQAIPRASRRKRKGK